MTNNATLCKITEPFIIGDDRYDLSELRRIHRAWTPVMWISESLHRIDDETFLSISRSPLLHWRNTAEVFVTSRVGAIDSAIRTNAPDAVLEELGVEIRYMPEDPRPFDRTSLRTRLIAVVPPRLLLVQLPVRKLRRLVRKQPAGQPRAALLLPGLEQALHPAPGDPVRAQKPPHRGRARAPGCAVLINS